MLRCFDIVPDNNANRFSLQQGNAKLFFFIWDHQDNEMFFTI